MSHKYEQFLEKLLKNESMLATSYEKRLSEELNSMRERHESELSALRNNLSALQRTESSINQRQVQNLENVLSELQSSIKAKDSLIESLGNKNKELSLKIESELFDLKVSEKSKKESIERMTQDNAALKSRVEQLLKENSALLETQKALKEEIFKQKSSFADETASLRAEAISLRNQISHYEQVEKEVDRNLLAASAVDDAAYLGHLNTVPIANGRRIKQILELGRRLSETEQKLMDALKNLEKEKLIAQNLKLELDSTKSLCEKMKSPGN